MKNFLTLLIAMLLLLPTAMHGTGKKVVTSIDITIPLPKDGMGIEDGEQIQITAAKTAYGDLVQQGIASVFSILWEGEFNRKNSVRVYFLAPNSNKRINTTKVAVTRFSSIISENAVHTQQRLHHLSLFSQRKSKGRHR